MQKLLKTTFSAKKGVRLLDGDSTSDAKIHRILLASLIKEFQWHRMNKRISRP